MLSLTPFLAVAALQGATSPTPPLPPSAPTVRKEVRIIEHRGSGNDYRDVAEGGAPAQRSACKGTKTEVSAASAADPEHKQQARVVLCTTADEGRDGAIKAVETAIGRLKSEPNMDPALKAELSAKLQARLAELEDGK